MNAYDAWAAAAWAASSAITFGSMFFMCLRINKRNHAERMKELDIRAAEATTRQYEAMRAVDEPPQLENA